MTALRQMRWKLLNSGLPSSSRESLLPNSRLARGIVAAEPGDLNSAEQRGQGLALKAGGVQVLVISRKQNEQLHIGDDITITVVDVKKGRVRLGIDAPKDVVIRRAELSFDSSPAPVFTDTPTGVQAVCFL